MYRREAAWRATSAANRWASAAAGTCTGGHGGYRESHQAEAVHGRDRGISPAVPPQRAVLVTLAPLRTAASSSGRDQRDTMDSGSTNRKSSSAHTSAVSSNSETKVSASEPGRKVI